MSTRTSMLTCAALLAMATVAGLVLYPQLPDPMPSHWDAAGNVDGTMSRTWAVLLLPLMTAGLAVLLFAIPSMDPLRANIERFRTQYNGFVVGVVAIAAGFLGEVGFWLMVAVLVAAALVPVVYSYVLWRRLGRPATPS